MSEGLVYVGKIINLEPIPGADFIVSATVVCGNGGKWRGLVQIAIGMKLYYWLTKLGVF